MIGVITGVAGLSHPPQGGWGQWAPEALRTGLSVVEIALPAVVAVIVAAAAVRAWRGARALRQRTAVAMVPTESFDPSPEEVTRFASQLTRLRPSTRLVPSSALAVRVRLTSLPGGRMTYQLEGPQRSRSVLRLGGYSGVELRAEAGPDGGATGDDPPPACLVGGDGSAGDDPPPDHDVAVDDEPSPSEEGDDDANERRGGGPNG